jgi:nucleotide-binding universal stress UspA family protein
MAPHDASGPALIELAANYRCGSDRATRSSTRKELTMNKILIAVDGSASSDAALRSGLEIAEGEGASVVLVHVAPAVEKLPVSLFGATASMRHEPNESDRVALNDAEEIAEEHGVPATTRLLIGDPADEIVAYSDSLGADLIVVGSRGLGALGQMILGSVSRGVLRESHTQVLVVREVEAAVPATVY